MRKNSAIFGTFRGVGLSQPRGQITGKAPTCQKRQIETCLATNPRLSGECRVRLVSGDLRRVSWSNPAARKPDQYNRASVVTSFETSGRTNKYTPTH